MDAVDNPPDVTYTGCHMESLRMKKLADDYIKRNPQVWQTSTSGSGSIKPQSDECNDAQYTPQGLVDNG